MKEIVNYAISQSNPAAAKARQQANPFATTHWHVDCASGTGLMNQNLCTSGKFNAVIRSDVGLVHESILIDEKKLYAWLEHIRSGSKRHCESLRQAGRIPSVPSSYSVFVPGNTYIFYACLPMDGAKWTIPYNRPRSAWLAKVEAQRLAEARHSARSNFVSQFGVEQIVNGQQLQANPFLFKGKIVGIRSSLMRMLSEKEGLFQVPGGLGFVPGFIATNVPSTQFRGNEPIVLAMKMVGLKDGLPFGEYVGVYWCQKAECADFVQ